MVEKDVLVGIAGNVVSTVGIVIANKYLYSGLGFRYMLALSTFHFFFTAAATRLLLACGLFTYKHATPRQVMPLVVGAVGSVGFMNLNLAHNSVGFYQISKLVCIPVTLALQWFMTGATVSTRVRYTLAVILTGVYVAQVADVELNPTGTLYATAAVLSTTLAQIFTNTIQRGLGLNHMQLLYHTSPLIGLGMLTLVPVFDDVGSGDASLFQFEWNAEVVAVALFTGLFAVGVNVTNYLVIGKTSPLTYLVVGHLKTCLILVLGFVVFSYPVVQRNVIGIVIAVVGMVWYSLVKQDEAAAAKLQLPVTSPSAAKGAHAQGGGDADMSAVPLVTRNG